MLENGNKIGSYRILRLLENMLVGSYGRAVLSDWGVEETAARPQGGAEGGAVQGNRNRTLPKGRLT